MIAVQTISHGRKIKCYLKEKKSRKSIGSHKFHVAEAKVELYFITLIFQIRGQTVTEYLSSYLATL